MAYKYFSSFVRLTFEGDLLAGVAYIFLTNDLKKIFLSDVAMYKFSSDDDCVLVTVVMMIVCL